MILKKREFFLLIFLILLQSCAGGRIGNFLESSFNDLEEINQDKDFKKNLTSKKNIEKEEGEVKDKNYKKIKKEENPKNVLENKKNIEKEEGEVKDKNYKKIKKEENPKNVLENKKNKKNKNSEKLQKKKVNKIKSSSKKRKIELQSYKIIFILKDVDPKDPTKDLNTTLRNSEVNFEIEKIERILDSKNKSMNKN